MGKYYLSKNYKELNSAGNKAKTDIEKILSEHGYCNAGLPQTTYQNNIVGFFLTLISVLRILLTISVNDIVILQYPLKKYYSFACRLVHLKKGKVITLVHDLGSFRRKKLTIEKEIKRLSSTDSLIVHNQYMKKWLLQQGHTKPIVCLEIFDYLSPAVANDPIKIENSPYKVIYAGALSYRKNRFLYLLDDVIHGWQFNLYGNGFEEERIHNKSSFNYKGFIPSDQLIEHVDGDFGLVWDGDSISTCSGNFGEYLKLNNPHKTSLYIRSHLPIIIWKEAALATFIADNKIGICINSLDEIEQVLHSITAKEYQEMKYNIGQVSQKLSSGYYTVKAVKEAKMILMLG
ncbi:galactofuranosyltransferase [Parabacteroides sp. OttesenSCG-928-G07]|nr:galactofuranosyltransferase [Parabacteroides sp. OttesenSCG-928-G21]MDL2278830.1 galactofuranosyltransferase [Parabacteroides sp. OttesenSCG-928-G07]